MTSFSSLLAFGDWTLDINFCSAIMSLVLFKILAFLVIAFPLLLMLGVFLKEQFWPKEVETALSTSSAGPAPASGGRMDETLGLVFDEKPQEVDDLKAMTGVAGVLEGKLHEFGVYTYRQIALWTDDMAREFGERLSFSDRVFRDNWREQCLALHRKKYGSDPS